MQRAADRRWRLTPAALAAGALAASLAVHAHAGMPAVPRSATPAAARGFVPPQGVMQRALAANRLSMQLTNCGSFASNHLFDGGPSYGGLEFPNGSGKLVGFAGGLWFSGRAAGSLRTAITEYSTEFVPGPWAPVGPGLDTTRYRIYSIARDDTTGSGTWMARAVPLGAPVDSTATHPGLIGDQTLWTIYTDAGVATQLYGQGPRTPIGLEVQLTAYAFDRAPALQDVVFLHFRVIRRGSDALDSAYVGLWYDADMRSARIPGASDSSLDMEYVYRTDDDVIYGAAGPATGVAVLRGPRDPATGLTLRPRSIVGYRNGNDPYYPEDYDRVMQGFYPWGPAMLDSTTMQPTLFYAWGDPVTGSGWLMPDVIDMKLALGLGPFRFAPGDTQEVDVALAVGQGNDRAGSVVALRDNVREARVAFASGFRSVPGPRPVVLDRIVARPVPSSAIVLFDVGVPSSGARVALEIVDLAGRRVRTIDAGWLAGGTRHVSWDGTRESGARAAAGVYFARSNVAGRIALARVVLMR